MRRASRVDDNQAEIVAGLLYMGATVQHLHAVGQGCPDLLIGWKGRNYLIEIKDGNKPPSARRLTTDQERWHSLWTGQKSVVTSLEEAMQVVNCGGVASG
jgi:hypothetical protein